MNAAAGLNLAGVASANLSGVAQLSMLLSLMASAKLGLPAGSCALLCPVAMLGGLAAA